MRIKIARRVTVLLVLFYALTAAGMSTAFAQQADPPPAGSGRLCSDNEAAPWAVTASVLFRSGDVAAAAEIYRAVLAVQPTDSCAVRGMAAVAENAAAKALTEKAQVPFTGEVSDTWAEAVRKYFAPLDSPLLVVLGTALMLLIVARLATPSAVRPDDRAWSSAGLRLAATATGFTLVGLAALAPIAIAGLPAIKLPEWPGAILVVIGPIATYLVAAGAQPKDRIGTGLLRSPGAAVLAVATGAAGVVWLRVGEFRALWVITGLFSLVLGLMGAALLAMTRGQLLRLAVDVRDTSGSSDNNASQYVVGRLAELGSQPPRGARIPVFTDVTDLPTDVLSALPDTALAKAVFRLVQVFRTAVPWRATISLTDATTITVALTRNGQTVSTSKTFNHKKLHLPQPAKADDPVARRQLLTAAAAHILIVLSDRHLKLRSGLCGAADSCSVAMYAIATDPSEEIDSDVQASLITAAVAADPDNALARFGDRYTHAWVATAEIQQDSAVAMEREYKNMPTTEGYEALRLRMLSFIASTRVNALLMSAQRASGDRRRPATKALRKYAEALVPQPDEHLAPLVAELRTNAYLLVTGTAHVVGVKGLHRALAAIDPQWKPADLSPQTAGIAYDRACWRSMTRTGRDWKRQALDDLRIAVTSKSLRGWAVDDPSLDNLRQSGAREEFRDLVCDAPADFLAITGIATHASALRRICVNDETDLLPLPPATVAGALRLPIATTRKWAGIAGLVTGANGAKGMPVSMVDTLVRHHVCTHTDLERFLSCDWKAKITKRDGLFLPRSDKEWSAYRARSLPAAWWQVWIVRPDQRSGADGV